MDSPSPAPTLALEPDETRALRAALAKTAIHELIAPPAWRSIEFISDLHLQPQSPQTAHDWAQYLAFSTADAIFLLGDIFEAWVGDDALDEADSYEAQCAAILRQASMRHALFLMHGNRDFLIGEHFAQAANAVLLKDPTCLVFAQQRWLLSHGDALCVDDSEYQRFRAMARNPAWQQQVLAQTLAQRRQLAGSMRSQSEARKVREIIYADVDHPAALQWLTSARAQVLIHGHTHRPAEHTIDAHHRRIVLSDWDTDTDPERAEVLRLDTSGLRRIALSDYTQNPPQRTD